MPRDTSSIFTFSIFLFGLIYSERLRRMPDRSEPLPAYFSSSGVLVVPLSDLKKIIQASKK